MSKVAVVYWSGTGNTEAMAQLVAAGARTAGAEASVFSAAEFAAPQLAEFSAVAFGCPAMGAEELEEDEFAPLFEACGSQLGGVKLGLFGSYGWGDGEWMRTWQDQCAELGATLVSDGVICCGYPEGAAESECRDLGAALA